MQQKARLLDPLRLLAEGKSVTEAALETGYCNVSGFIGAFKNTLVYPPGRWYDHALGVFSCMVVQ